MICFVLLDCIFFFLLVWSCSAKYMKYGYTTPLFFFRRSSVSGQPTPISTSPLLDPVKGIPSTPGPGDSQEISLWRPGPKVDSMKKSASAEKM